MNDGYWLDEADDVDLDCAIADAASLLPHEIREPMDPDADYASLDTDYDLFVAVSR